VDFDVNRSTTDHIFCIWQVVEKKWGFNVAVHKLFIDSEKEYDLGEKHCSILSLNLIYA
jgi:hypothetical protein